MDLPECIYCLWENNFQTKQGAPMRQVSFQLSQTLIHLNHSDIVSGCQGLHNSLSGKASIDFHCN